MLFVLEVCNCSVVSIKHRGEGGGQRQMAGFPNALNDVRGEVVNSGCLYFFMHGTMLRFPLQ